jgi:hypothetical protein
VELGNGTIAISIPYPVRTRLRESEGSGTNKTLIRNSTLMESQASEVLSNNRMFEALDHKIDIKIVNNQGDLLEISMKISKHSKIQDNKTNIKTITFLS